MGILTSKIKKKLKNCNEVICEYLLERLINVRVTNSLNLIIVFDERVLMNDYMLGDYLGKIISLLPDNLEYTKITIEFD